jgi:threonine dehydratase
VCIASESRQEAERVSQDAVAGGATLIPPFDYDDVICGQGTSCLEALQDLSKLPPPPGRTGVATRCDAVFAPVGGGGLLSGTLIASQVQNPPPFVFGAEPLAGNDAARSVATGSIGILFIRYILVPFIFLHFICNVCLSVVTLTEQPKTLADGAMTLGISPRTFAYLKRVNHVSLYYMPPLLMISTVLMTRMAC